MGKELALKIYVNMVTLQTMDTLFYEAQRQGRFSFYMSSFGEEAINIASAASLSPDDHILAQVWQNLYYCNRLGQKYMHVHVSGSALPN